MRLRWSVLNRRADDTDFKLFTVLSLSPLPLERPTVGGVPHPDKVI